MRQYTRKSNQDRSKENAEKKNYPNFVKHNNYKTYICTINLPVSSGLWVF